MATKKRGLGRGLDALLGSGNQGAREEPDNESDGLRTVPVEFLKPGRYQPRTGMDPERLAELADSIRAQGLIQPIVVRPQGRSEERRVGKECVRPVTSRGVPPQLKQNRMYTITTNINESY